MIDAVSAVVSVRAPPKNIGMKMKMFFTQCFGRMSLRRLFNLFIVYVLFSRYDFVEG